MVLSELIEAYKVIGPSAAEVLDHSRLKLPLLERIALRTVDKPVELQRFVEVLLIDWQGRVRAYKSLVLTPQKELCIHVCPEIR